jgi:precorrin-3B methylase
MESNEVKILAIIPINKYDDSAKELIGYAIGSIPKEIDIKVSVSDGLREKVEKAVEEANDGKNVSVVSTDTDSYTKLVNVAVSDDYEWFTILDITD